jgi:hypothetical protein
MTPSTQTAYVLDEITAKPGKAKALLETYLSDYAPAARERGMVLDRVLVSPPLWMDEQPNTLHITWTIAGAPGFWSMSHQGRRNPAVRAFWDSVEPLIETRSRRFLAASADVEAMCDV